MQDRNVNLLSNYTTPFAARSCSSCQKSERPLNNECLSKSLVYKAAVSKNLLQINKYCYGTCEKNFQRTVQQSP